MCRFKKLCHTENGYVVRCNQCRHIHIAFGTTILAFTRDQYHDFVRMIGEQYRLHKNDCCRDQKIIQIPTDARSIMLAYTPGELEKLFNLLEKANTLIDKEQFFSFNGN